MKTSTLALLFGCLTVCLFGVNTYDIVHDKSIALDTPNLLTSQDPEDDNVVSNSVSLGSVFRFKANVTNINNDCIESSSVSLSDLEWKVTLCKKDDPTVNYFLAVLLESSANDNTLKYACEVKATFKLLPIPGQTQNVLRQIMPKHKHTNANPTFVIEKFTTWNEFISYVSHQNETIFEIDLSTIRFHPEESTDTEPFTSRINVRLENVSQITQTYSPVVVARGIEWRVNIMKAGDYLAVRLEANDKQLNTGFFYTVEASFKLLPINNSLKPLNQEFRHDYRFGSSEYGVERFVSWNELNNKYVSEDRASLLVQFKIGNPQSLWDIDSNDLS